MYLSQDLSVISTSIFQLLRIFNKNATVTYGRKNDGTNRYQGKMFIKHYSKVCNTRKKVYCAAHNKFRCEKKSVNHVAMVRKSKAYKRSKDT